MNIESPRDIRRAAEAFARESLVILKFKYRIAPWHDIASCRPMVDAEGKDLMTEVFGWIKTPDEMWWKRPIRKTPDQVSPLVAACRFQSEPFWCNAEGFRTQISNPFLKHVRIDKFAKRSGIYAAIVVPVHLPFGQIGVVAFAPTDSKSADLSTDFKNYSDVIGLYSRRFISGYVSATSSGLNVTAGANLSPREVACLYWAAAAKSNEEIGTILSLSVATVRFHIGNAAEKLNAVNRGQAILKAARLGYIRLRP